MPPEFETNVRRITRTRRVFGFLAVTLVECARRHGHDPEAYLADILDRLPAMTNQDDLSILLPCNWQPGAATPALEVEAAINV